MTPVSDERSADRRSGRRAALGRGAAARQGTMIALRAEFRRRRGTPPLVEAMRGRRHLIVSPFLDDPGVLDLADDGSEAVMVVSRPEARAAPAHDCRWAGVSHPEPDGRARRARRGRHLGPTDRGQGSADCTPRPTSWSRGSRPDCSSVANATTAGLMEHNVEFVIEMQAGRKQPGHRPFHGSGRALPDVVGELHPGGGAEPAPEETLRREVMDKRCADWSISASPHDHRGRRGVDRDGGGSEGHRPPRGGWSSGVGLLTRPGSAPLQTSTGRRDVQCAGHR